jgi:hypothetical protein
MGFGRVLTGLGGAGQIGSGLEVEGRFWSDIFEIDRSRSVLGL